MQNYQKREETKGEKVCPKREAVRRLSAVGTEFAPTAEEQ